MPNNKEILCKLFLEISHGSLATVSIIKEIGI
jgi:hypothetical protein